MSIEQTYIDKIEEIKQNNDKLTDWETKFIFGDDDSTPIDTRPQLSISQKSIIDRIYDQRVNGVKSEPVTEVKFSSDRVIANKAETGSFIISIDGKETGPNVSQREAVAIVGWLSETIDTIKALEDAPF